MNRAATALLLAALALAGRALAHAGELAPAWVFPATGRIAPVHSSPTVYGGIVYVADDSGRLYGLWAKGRQAGTLVPGFPVQLDGPVRGRPAVYGDRGSERIYVATTRGTLYAFRLDGTPAWSQSLGPNVSIVSTPAVRGPYVYVSSSSGRIYRRLAYDGSDAKGLTYGRAVWTRTPKPQRVAISPAFLEVADATRFFDSGRVRVTSRGPLGDFVETDYTYHGRNTRVRPHRLLNVSPVGVTGRTVLHPAGSIVAGFGPGARADESPAVPGTDESTLVIAALQSTGSTADGVAGRNLVGLRSEPFGLVPQWEVSYGAEIRGAPVVDVRTGNLFVGSWKSAGDPSRGGELHCIRASNGLPVSGWGNGGSLSIPGGAILAGPWLDNVDGSLYFGTSDGRLWGVDAANGALLFPPATLDGQAGEFASTPLVVNGRIYAGTRSGRLYSVSLENREAWDVYALPDGGSFDGSPSASGSRPGIDVVVIGASNGTVLAFRVQ
jgi:outer membrane protein assembly factor BamB